MSEAREGTRSATRTEAVKPELEENSIGPARRRAKAEAAPPPATRPQPSKAEHLPKRTDTEKTMPEEVRRRFVQMKNEYFFPDGAKAFTDRGDKLTTQSENTEVIRSLVTIAQSRGWGKVRVRGSERFRREAWVAAQTAGIEIRGYKPTEFEQSRLARTIAQLTMPASRAAESQPASTYQSETEASKTSGREGRPRGLLIGTLLEHGRAPYRNDSKEAMSYYAKVETAAGERMLWGVDLERAFKESLSKPAAGDLVGLRAVRREPVTVKARERDAQGKVIRERDLDTVRNRWIVEKREFFQERAVAAQTLRDQSIDPKQGARKHPELVGTYLQMHAAEIAAKQLRDPEDQKRFVEKVREALATSVARGDPLPPVRLKERGLTQGSAERSSASTPNARTSREREAAPVRG
ncbi:MAG TPA: LPD7 domain-containing protein [Vicinamibacterales bacterium]|nr:LPD7 domain-containing protein [Vicinamibacterales bacterium]